MATPFRTSPYRIIIARPADTSTRPHYGLKMDQQLSLSKRTTKEQTGLRSHEQQAEIETASASNGSE